MLDDVEQREGEGGRMKRNYLHLECMLEWQSPCQRIAALSITDSSFFFTSSHSYIELRKDTSPSWRYEHEFFFYSFLFHSIQSSLDLLLPFSPAHYIQNHAQTHVLNFAYRGDDFLWFWISPKDGSRQQFDNLRTIEFHVNSFSRNMDTVSKVTGLILKKSWIRNQELNMN